MSRHKKQEPHNDSSLQRVMIKITLFPAWVQSYSGIRTYSYLKLQGMWLSRINKSWISDYFNSMQVCLLISEMTTPPQKSNDRPHRRGDIARDAFRVTHPSFCRFSTHTLLRFFIELCHRQPNQLRSWRGGHSYKSLETFRTTTSTRFDFKVFRLLSKNRLPGILHGTFFRQKS